MAVNLAYDLFQSGATANAALVGRLSTSGHEWVAWGAHGPFWSVNGLTDHYRDNLTDDAPKGVRYPTAGAGAARANFLRDAVTLQPLNFAPYNVLRADFSLSRVTPAAARGACGVGFVAPDNILPSDVRRGLALGIDWAAWPVGYTVAIYGIEDGAAGQIAPAAVILPPLADVAPFSAEFGLELVTIPAASDPFSQADYIARIIMNGATLATFSGSGLGAFGTIPRLGVPFIFSGDYSVAVGVPPLDYFTAVLYSGSGVVSVGGSLSWQPINDTDYQYSTTLDFSAASRYSLPLETTFDGNRRARIMTLVLSTENATAPVSLSLNGINYTIPVSRELIIPAPNTPEAIFLGGAGQLNVKGYTMHRNQVLTYQRES